MSKKNTPFLAVIWSLLERLSSQAVSFVIGVVLARLLTPNEYGIVGLTTIFISLSNTFVDAGFANGLIRKIDRTEKDLSTAFYFNIAIGIVAYGILWLCSPIIANFFNEPILIPLVKIIGLSVLLNSLCVVQSAILTANLNIRLQTIINLCGQIPAGLIAILLAYRGWGVYALALQTVLAAFIRTTLLWIFAKWRPHEKFSKESFSYLFGFGSKLLGANLIGTVFNEIYSVLIGKFFTKADLGYFSKANGLSNNFNSVASGIVQKVALPVLSRHQNDKVQLQENFREIMRLLVMIIAPLSAFLCFSGRDIIVFLWTDKWLPAVVLFQIIVAGTMWNPIGQLSLSLLQVANRTGLILKLEFPKKAIYVVIIFIGFQYGVLGIAATQFFINFVAAAINLHPTKKILDYSYVQQMVDVIKYMVIAYPIAWGLSLLINTDIPLLNILLNFLTFLPIYGLVILAIRDSVAVKYFAKIKGKFKKA
ncbi:MULTISPECIES: lipopolysaccharide biosynthesis protein [unclassified Fibrobacter]|uniref:lipopolysaccharide biosynthesis protein n=1 Tax=unclassified Fibrobacter TaxID=2634177 RepID=UPI000D6CF61A|nr:MULTISPECIES: lipopolysaccharide biosynthesis protein [unclassified Fibrobacter]PWJ64030.1 O-antigen/teichoic acid export membrane protein [Fibrobacter sp. UWR4]PZW69233.1 O-antigen/teichoic acid export membrane protein [Fibrobacter sp. UWR1]